MTKLKRNMIELVKDVQGEEVITEKYWTPVFIPLTVVYEAIDLMEEAEAKEAKERDILDKFIDFVASKVYKGQFTKDELINGLHAPDAIPTLREQIFFIAQGQQTDETKKFLAKKN